jgi:uncharacterized protein YegL
MTRAVVLCAVIAGIAPGVATQEVFRAAIEVIAIDVSVLRGGRPVTGLGARDFVVTDNAVVQQVTSVTLEQMPLHVTMVLDVSSSVSGERLAQLTAAGEGLGGSLRTDDRVSVIAFSHAVHAAVPMTSDFAVVRRGLSGLVGRGSTALRDAIQLAVLAQPRLRTARSLIMVFSDGQDTASWVTERQVLDSARHAGVVTHIIRFGPDAFLDRLALATGGRNWSARSESQLRELFTQALQEMRSRYLLTYTPSGTQTTGWHQIAVRLNGQRAEVSARQGYYVPEPRARE